MQRKIFGTLFVSNLLLALALPVGAVKQDSATTQFKQIEQPIALKLGVTLGGAALIGLELWWFLYSKPKA